jgi:DNA-binding XRE family transcriptional regulator
MTVATPEVSAAERMHPLERVRHSVGLSREQLAAAAGVSTGTIYGIERCGVSPQRATRAVLAMTLGLMPGELFPDG